MIRFGIDKWQNKQVGILIADLRAKISKALAEYGEGLVIRAWFATKPVLLVADGNIAEVHLLGISLLLISPNI